MCYKKDTSCSRQLDLFLFLLILALQSLVDLSLFQNCPPFQSQKLLNRTYFYEVELSSPMPNPKSGGPGLNHHPWPFWHGRPYQWLHYQQHSFQIIWTCKPHHYVKVGIPLGWGREHWTLHNRNLQVGTWNTQWHKRVWWTVEHSFDKNVSYLQFHDTNDFISIRIILWQ